MTNFNTNLGRINKFKGDILKHATPNEVLAKLGRQVSMPKNSSDTYVARRIVPYSATLVPFGTPSQSNPNQFFGNPTAGMDRGAAILAAHVTQEAVTPSSDNLVVQDIAAQINQYSCLYGFSDKLADLYEDDIPKEIKNQIGERVALVNEMIVYGALKSCTNVFYAGTGSSIATTNGVLTLNLIRKITRNMQANHARPITTVLKASPNVATEPVESGYVVVCHTDFEPDIRNIVGFIPTSKYATGTAMQNEIGRVERFRFITSPDLPPMWAAGAAGTVTGTSSVINGTALSSITGSANIDIYPFFVLAQDAFSQIALRGKESINPTYIAPDEKSKSDPHGQRGYAGAIWWKGIMIENNQWMALGYAGVAAL